MSKKVFVLSVQPEEGGPTFGRVMDPDKIQDLQDYAHGHTEQVTKNLLVAGAPGAQVAGFAAVVAGGLNVSVATGVVVDAAGVTYESPTAASVVTVPAAHVSLPRIDLIIATLEIDAPALSEFVSFRQLRTQVELEAGADPYVPTQFNQPQELHTRVTISVKPGVANASPVAPVAGAGEVALWQVAVAAGQAVLINGNLTSVRVLMKSLYSAIQDVLVLQGQMAVLPETVQDIVGAFPANGDGSLTLAYNDGANTFSLVLAAAYKALLDGATNNNTVSTLVKRDASGNFNAGIASLGPVTAVGTGTASGEGGLKLMSTAALGTTSVLLTLKTPGVTGGAKFALCGIAGQNSARFSIFHGRGSDDTERFQIDEFNRMFFIGNVTINASGADAGDLAVSGNLSKGSGTFLIDHPLDPDDKDLTHGFIEAPRFDLIYRGRVQLVAGEAEVDIDAASGMAEGTFAALCQNVQCLPPNAESGWDKVRVQPGSLSGGQFVIECENPASTIWVGWVVIAERKDDFVKSIAGTDEDGHLVVETNKPAPDLSLLDPVTRQEIGEEEGSVVVEEVVHSLVGTQGYRRHARVTGEGNVPVREVTIETVLED